MEKISWSDHVRNRSITKSQGGENTLHTIKKRKAKWIGHILRRNCFLKHATKGKKEGRIEVAERRVRSYKQLLNDLKTRGYWKLKKEVLDRILWRIHLGRCYVPNVRQTAE